MTGSIICGVDDSDSAKGAARVARTLAGELGLGLVFVRVVDGDGPGREVAAEVAAIAKRLEGLSAGANDLDAGAEWVVEAGHPADSLVAAAKKARAEMIVVGSTGPHSSLLGSISADVSRRAPCPVVVVPPGADKHRNDPGRNEDDDRDYAGGIVRFGLGGSKEHADFAGGIVRFNLGSGER